MERLTEKVLQLGAYKACIINAKDIPTDVIFRSMCESNACGKFGKNYQCPPHVGNIEDLIKKVYSFDKILVYQTVTELEDSYDFEGMMKAGDAHNHLVQTIRAYVQETFPNMKVLHLGAGGCRICKNCGVLTNEPCRFPELAIGSLEAHGINVSQLAEKSNMKYINGQNTVTYFGAILF